MKRRSLHTILAMTWILPGLLALVLSVSVFFGLGWIQYRQSIQRVTADLEQKSQVVARRLSAELLIGRHGAEESVSKLLASDLSLKVVEVDRRSACPNRAEHCAFLENGKLVALRKVPIVNETAFVRLVAGTPTYRSGLDLRLLVWSSLPVFLVVLLVALGQRWALNRFVAKPVRALVAHASTSTEPPAWWSKEYAHLAGELRGAFLKRDLAMIGQLSGGVMHDLRTLLHSTWSAAQLVQELPKESEKRAIRMEAFLRASEINLPKMQSLIETTLDGAREIRIRLESKALEATLQSALETTRALAQHSAVSVVVDLPKRSVLVTHDPVQLERAFSNIIRNGIEAAAEATGPDKRVRIKLEEVASGPIVSVEDSGSGLGAAPASVFDSLRSTKVRGTGLGLVVSRKIVEAHGGRIAASHSVALPGAKFEIHLPSDGMFA